MFNFDEYKKYLIDYYKWECDNNEESYNKRKWHVNHFYSDEDLNNIVINTEEFIHYLMGKLTTNTKVHNDNIFDNVELIDEPPPHIMYNFISNGCGGGWHSDELFFMDNKENDPISLYLTKQFFGKSFRMNISRTICEYYNEEEETGCEYGIIQLEIVGPLQKFYELYDSYDEIYNNNENRFEEQTKLIEVLKRIRDKNNQ